MICCRHQHGYDMPLVDSLKKQTRRQQTHDHHQARRDFARGGRAGHTRDVNVAEVTVCRPDTIDCGRIALVQQPTKVYRSFGQTRRLRIIHDGPASFGTRRNGVACDVGWRETTHAPVRLEQSRGVNVGADSQSGMVTLVKVLRGAHNVDLVLA